MTTTRTNVSSDVKIAQRISLGIQFAAVTIMVGTLITSIAISYNFIIVPGSDQLTQASVPQGQPFYLSAWYPFQACYIGSCGGYPYRLLPQGWPASTEDSDRLVNLDINTAVAGYAYLTQQFASTPPAASIVSLLNWGQTAGIGVDLDDATLWSHIKGDSIMTPLDLDTHIQGLVRNYGAHPGLGGWYVGNEPEAWGSTPTKKETMYARLGDAIARFKAADPNHRVYATTATASKLRFCREGQMSILLNSGFSYLRTGTIADDSAAFQAQLDTQISNFNEDYLCTKNYGIPVAYSIAADYWAGDTITAAETNMFAYLSLAHGIQGVEWFPYSTTGGLVWDNQVPSQTLNFSNWLPSMWGGRIYLDPTYASGTSGGNVGLQVDNVTRHGGSYSAKINMGGPVTDYYNLRQNPPDNPNSPWPPKFPELKASTQYTASGWVKISGTADVQFKATGPSFGSLSSTLTNTNDWTQLSTTFTTPATIGRWTFGPLVNSATGATVWFDDFSLIEVDDPAQRNIAEDYNPGFETVTGADRTPHEPLYGAVRQVNTDFATLGPIFSTLTRLSAFSDQGVPTSGLVTGVSSVVSQGLPRAEVGVFATAPTGGDYYVVVVNRNISSSATVSLTLSAPNAVALDDVLAGTTQQFSSDGAQVAATVSLDPGAGKAFHVRGITYSQPVETPAYSEDFEDGQAQGWTNDGGTWTVVDDGGNQVYDVQSGASEVRGIATNQTFGDFEYSGTFEIMPDHNVNSVMYFTFRKDPATSINTNKYDLRVKLDPGAESTNGFVHIGRRNLGSTTYLCNYNEENFLLGQRYIDFNIRAMGGTIEVTLDGVKYLTCIDSSGSAFSSGYVGLRLDANSHVRFDDLAVNSLSSADAGCTESWTCADFSQCTDGSQSRTCTDANACGTTVNRPPLTQSCAVPVCTESWTCADFSQCTNGSQSRTCTDANACGTTDNQPPLAQSCTSPPPSPAPPPACVQNIQCGDWSSCNVNGVQTRHCTDLNQCAGATPSDYDDPRPCIAVGGSGDQTPPQTNALSLGPIVYSSTVQIPLGGTDNVSAASTLQFLYRLDGAAERVVLTGQTLTLVHLTNGVHTLAVRAVDEASNEDATPVAVSFTVRNVLSIVTGLRGRSSTEVRTFDYLGKRKSRFIAFPTYRTGVSVTTLDGDANGSGEIAAAPGRGGPPEVRIFTSTGKLIRKFSVYPSGFRGGVNLATLDINGDGRDEIVVAPASGRGPFIRIFSATGTLLGEAAAFSSSFRGGVNLAAGQLSSTGAPTILAAPATGGSAQIAQMEWRSGKLVVVKRLGLGYGKQKVAIRPALGNVNGTGNAEIILRVETAKAGSDVLVLNANGRLLKNFNGTPGSGTDLVVATGDLRGFDRSDEIATANERGGVNRVAVFTSDTTIKSIIRRTTFTAYSRVRAGLNLAIGHL